MPTWKKGSAPLNGYAYHVPRANKPIIHHCISCGRAYPATRSHAKTCSDRCRKSLSRARQSTSA